ncbi:hypothetical protein FB107DRAFT_251624 [Schizophyllum commune]
MLPHSFASAERREWAAQEIIEPRPARTGRTIQDVFSPELWFMTLENCSPMDVKNLRAVCGPIRHFIDDNPSIWVVTRGKTGNVPPPPDPEMPEWKWTVIVFTGTLDAARKVVPAWADQYGMQWKEAHRANMAKIDGMLNKDEPLDPGAARRRLSEYIRSPTLERVMKVHRRDLRVMTSATWHALLPTIRREIGLIASCDVSKVPAGFRYYTNDRIVCPLCHPKPEELHKTIDELTGKKQKRRWFHQHTVAVDDLLCHYVSVHRHIRSPKIPEIELYTRCSTCEARPYRPGNKVRLRTMFTAAGLLVHNRKNHGVVNPAPEGRWFTNHNIGPGPAIMREGRNRFR